MGLLPAQGSPTGTPAHRQRGPAIARAARQGEPSWATTGFRALANLGHELSDRSVANILKRHAVEPSPLRKRQSMWATFLKCHWEVLAATDFTTVEVWTRKGLVTFYLLFVMELAIRRVQCAGITTNSDEPWMKLMARNLTVADDGFLCGKRYLTMNRDSKFTAEFRQILTDAGIRPVRLPTRSPNLNAHLERFWRSLRQECIDRLVFFGERMLRRAIREFLQHYHGERNHQGLVNRLIDPGPEVGRKDGALACRERLGGLMRYYYRDAA